jgi:S-formylglutathione hydrolase FrmB
LPPTVTETIVCPLIERPTTNCTTTMTTAMHQATPTATAPQEEGRGEGRSPVLVRSAIAIAAVCVATLVAAGGAQAATGSPISVVSERQLDARLSEYVLRTPALSTTTPLRVLLPTGYAKHPRRRYPVLYLLHGCCNSPASGAASWTTAGDAEADTAKLPLIVVMPDAGEGGMYTDWYNNGAGAEPEWETYHVDQLIPWVDSVFRTVAARPGRAIAGLSMGGFGAMSYAARHPDLFVFAASFSGIVDNHDALGDFQQFDEGLAARDGGIPGSLWGRFATDSIRWEAHDPADLAMNLRGSSLQLRTGNGMPGGAYGGGPSRTEMLAHRESVVLDQALDDLKIPHLWDDYGAGAHAWAYWNHDLQESLPDMMATFASPPAPPATVNFTAVESDYEVYGWQVSLQRPVLEFSTLSDARRSGFSLSGSGSATVTTPAILRPGQPVVITSTMQTGATTIRKLQADHKGRLVIDVTLGPPNPEQEGLPGAATHVYHTGVSIGPMRGRSRLLRAIGREHPGGRSAHQGEPRTRGACASL